jgi:signal peptidase II
LSPKLRVFLATCLPLVAADVVTKELALRFLRPFVPYPVLDGWFRLTLGFNRYGAMGLTAGSWSRVLFGTLALAALVALGALLKRSRPADRWRAAAIGLLAAGAAGNLWDRVRWSRGVVDFVDVGVGRLRFWTFNVADAALTVGVIALALVLWREDVARARPADGGAP